MSEYNSRDEEAADADGNQDLTPEDREQIAEIARKIQLDNPKVDQSTDMEGDKAVESFEPSTPSSAAGRLLEEGVVSCMAYLGDPDHPIVDANADVVTLEIGSKVQVEKTWSKLTEEAAYDGVDTYKERSGAVKALNTFKEKSDQEPWIEANIADPCECGGSTVVHSKGVNYKKTCDTCGGDKTVGCGRCGEGGILRCGRCSGSGQVKCHGHNCRNGKQQCWRCHGSRVVYSSDARGNVRCNACNGLGDLGNCLTCWGSGRVDCGRCQTSGHVTCDTCGGRGRVLCTPCDATGKTTHGLSISASMKSSVSIAAVEGFSNEDLKLLLRQDGRDVARGEIEKDGLKGVVSFTTKADAATKEAEGLRVRGLGAEAPLVFAKASQEKLWKDKGEPLRKGDLKRLRETPAGHDLLHAAGTGKAGPAEDRLKMVFPAQHVTDAIADLEGRLTSLLEKGQGARRWRFWGFSFALAAVSLTPYLMNIPGSIKPTVVQLLLAMAFLMPIYGFTRAKRHRQRVMSEELGVDTKEIRPVSFAQHFLGGALFAALGVAGATFMTPVLEEGGACFQEKPPAPCATTAGYLAFSGQKIMAD